MSNPAIRHDRRAFVRDRATVACYSVFGAYSFWLYAFGPSLALLQAELGFSYTLIGGYSAAWAAGSIGAGVSFAPAMARLGARAMLWATAAVTTGGAGLFLASPTVAGTLVAAVVMGWAGTLVQTTVQSILSAGHGPRRDRALVEANIGAGACAMLAPVALGGLQASPATWRTAMALPAVALVGLAVAYRRQTLPAPERTATPSTRRGGLSLACWLLCLLTAVGIGVEFCVLYFGAQMLTATTGMSAAAAATAMTLVYAGILAGRLGGARLTRHPGRTVTLLWSSLAITVLGLCLLWLSANPTLALLGLFLTGLGIANQFPLALALTLAAAPGHTDTANARTQLLGAILLLTAPFLLGALAEYTGLIPAFTIAPALTAVSALLLYAGHRLTPTTSRDCAAQPS